MSEELNKATQDLSLESKTEESPATVLTSKDNVEVKHPLNSSWTLWYTKPPSPDVKESWADLLKPIITFSTVEEFWGIYNSIPTAQDLPLKADYHVFREGIKPEWEDEQNENGGRWIYKTNSRKTDINDIWLRALLSVIGETIQDDENEVNGIVLNNRKYGYKVSLWTKTVTKSKLVKIGGNLKKFLKLEEEDSIEFFSHKDADVRGAKPIIMV